MSSKTLLVLPALGLAFGLAACGDSNDESASTGTTTEEQTSTPSGPAGQTVNLSESEYKISPAKLSLDKGGTVAFKVSNEGSVTHALEVEQGENEFKSGDIAAGSSTTLKVDLKPGEYELYCPIDNHKDMGMKATLTVGGAASSGGTSTTEDNGTDTTEDDSGGTSAPDDSGDDSGGASGPDDSGY